MKKLLPVVVAAILLVAVGLQAYRGTQSPPEPNISTPLSQILPSSLDGWTVTELELGETESIRERSEQLLKLDDFVQREFKRNGQSFRIYVAYWKPGKMPVRLVNAHTPDRCWINVGFTCTEREWHVQDLPSDEPLHPAQFGVYEKGDYALHTYFWHIVNGEAHWYGGERMNRFAAFSSVFTDLKKFGLNVYREQFFIRVSSPDGFEELWKEEGFQKIMSSLSSLCLEPQQSS